ncbi:hypothetical protein BD309DRAFT_204580 [Dichomitus squalens]|nr:hypothetical protein BD309DRAFT_204580 [Dichomitus squalens]
MLVDDKRRPPASRRQFAPSLTSRRAKHVITTDGGHWRRCNVRTYASHRPAVASGTDATKVVFRRHWHAAVRSPPRNRSLRVYVREGLTNSGGGSPLCSRPLRPTGMTWLSPPLLAIAKTSLPMYKPDPIYPPSCTLVGPCSSLEPLPDLRLAVD